MAWRFDIIFVGAYGYHSEHSYRPQLIDWLRNNYKERFSLFGGDGLGVVRGARLNKLYASTKIVIGDTCCPNFKCDFYFSDRIFETLGRGGFIIHPRIKGLEEIFTEGVHIAAYDFGNFGELKEKIDYYLTHDEEREKIRFAGHELVKEKHTYKVRWEQILKTVFPNG